MMAGGAAAMLGCINAGDGGPGSARLKSRPGTPSSSVTPGTYPLLLGGTRDGLLLVPASYDPAKVTPFVLAFHGAGGSSSGPISLLGSLATEFGFLLLAVDSRAATWDGIGGHYGDDVQFIDQALKQTFDRCRVDPARVFLEGFSDGASYALGMGLANGDLFKRVIAFSPGFIPQSDSDPVGSPAFFISHGTQDTILPISSTRDTIVPYLRKAPYAVTYQEFDGGHQVPADIARQAVTWLFP